MSNERPFLLGGLGALLALAGLAWVARGVGVLDFSGTAGSGADAGAPVDGGDVEADGGVGILTQAQNVIVNTAAGQPTMMSDAGIAMLKAFEGFSATPYQDANGYSIGYGHFIKAGESFDYVDEAQADALLRSDVGWAERAVSSAVSASLSQAQFDALVSLCYNIGAGAFKASTLVRLLNAGDVQGAADQFPRWNRSGGVVNAALTQRRAAEESVFAGGSYV